MKPIDEDTSIGFPCFKKNGKTEVEVKVLDENKPYVVPCRYKVATNSIRVENRNEERNTEAVLHINEIRAYGVPEISSQ